MAFTFDANNFKITIDDKWIGALRGVEIDISKAMQQINGGHYLDPRPSIYDVFGPSPERQIARLQKLALRGDRNAQRDLARLSREQAKERNSEAVEALRERARENDRRNALFADDKWGIF